MNTDGNPLTTVRRFGSGAFVAGRPGELFPFDLPAPLSPSRIYCLQALDSEDGRLYRAGLACFLESGSDRIGLRLEPVVSAGFSFPPSLPLEEILDRVPVFPSPIPGSVLAIALTPALEGAAVSPLWETRVEECERCLVEPDRRIRFLLQQFHPLREEWAEFSSFTLSTQGAAASLEDLADRIATDLGWTPWRGSLLSYAARVGAYLPFRPLWEERDEALEQPLSDFAYGVLRQQAGRIFWNEPGVRLGWDAESLHDMRVATRRARAALRLFQEIFPARRAIYLRGELKWVAAALGNVRDLDVYLDRLAGLEEQIQVESRLPLEQYRAGLASRREMRRRTLLRTLASRRAQEMGSSLLKMVEAKPIQKAGFPAARARAGEAAERILRSPLRQFFRAGRKIGPVSSDAEFHALRIRAKRLRYALEFFREGLGSPAQDWIERLRTLQDLLGEHQDLVVGQTAIREFLQRGGSGHAKGEIAFALGQISVLHTQRAQQCRREFARLWSEWDHKKVRQPLEQALEMTSRNS